MSNTIIYQEEWETKLQERLSEKTKWEEICNVEYTNERVLHNPYMADPSAAAHTRGSVYSLQDITVTDDTCVINASSIVPQYIDRADLAQTNFTKQMDIAARQAVVLKEKIESYLYGLHASYTNFGDTGGGVLGLSATPITVSQTNIDDIVRGIKTQIRTANGEAMLESNGVFIVWRPTDLELVEAFCQANGYTMADAVLKDGIKQGFYALGVFHYSSNLLTAGHVFAGVRKVMHLGIVTDTYGQVVVNQDPAGPSGGQFSGVSVVTRVDYIGKAWHNVAPILFDVNVT